MKGGLLKQQEGLPPFISSVSKTTNKHKGKGEIFEFQISWSCWNIFLLWETAEHADFLALEF